LGEGAYFEKGGKGMGKGKEGDGKGEGEGREEKGGPSSGLRKCKGGNTKVWGPPTMPEENRGPWSKKF